MNEEWVKWVDLSDEVFEPRNVVFTCGPSGSGMSTYSSRYIEEYKKRYAPGPDNLSQPVDR